MNNHFADIVLVEIVAELSVALVVLVIHLLLYKLGYNFCHCQGPLWNPNDKFVVGQPVYC